MAATLVKALMLLLSINLLLYVAGVRVVGGDNEDFVSNFLNTTEYAEGRTVAPDNFKNTLPTSLEQSGTGILDFIDSLGAVKRFIFFVVNIVFTPLGLLMSTGMPKLVVLLIGMPLMTMVFLGVAYFIRSGS